MISNLAKLFKNNQFFASSILVFIAFSGFQVALLTQSFRNNFDKYSIILAVGAIFFLIKSFIYNFHAVLEVIKLKRGFLLFLDLTFFTAQIWLTFLALQYLTVSSYASLTFLYFALASTSFYVQTFSLPNRPLSNMALFTSIFYWSATALLFQTEWVNYTQQIYFLFAYFIAIVLFLSEGWMFFRSTRLFLKNDV